MQYGYMKISKKQQSNPLMSHYINNLWSAFTLADSKEEIREFIRDLFTHTEYKMFSKRLEIARRLLADRPYEEIMKELGVASHSVSSVSNVLAARGDGFRKAHQRLSDLEERHRSYRKSRQERLENPLSFSGKRKTVLGALVKAGVKIASSKIRQERKRRSAGNRLPV